MSILSQFFGNRGSAGIDTDVDAYIVVAGAGGGGGTSLNNLSAAGGGGAGAIIYGFAPLSFNQTYQVVIGSGGAANSVGGYSRLGGIVAYGGGAGGNGQEVAFSPSTHMGELGANSGGNGSSTSGGEAKYPNPIHVYESDLADKLSRENRSDAYYYDSKGVDVPRYSDRLIVTAGRRGGTAAPAGSSILGGGGGGAGSSMDHLREQTLGYFLRPLELSSTSQVGGRGGYGTIIPFFMQRTSSSTYFDTLIYSSPTIPTVNSVEIKDIYPYTFCGGGSGGSNTNDAQPAQDFVYGSGRGGDGNDLPVAADANSGSGGGGGASSNNNPPNRIGSNGGSGCVMICYPTSGYSAAVTTGSPTLNTSVRSGWRVYKYNSSGTFYLPG